LAALTAMALPPRTAVGAGEAVHIALHNGLVWADVECGGKTLHCVVDTGAASSCVDLAAAKRAGLRLGSAVTVAGVDGWTKGYRCVEFQGSLGGMKLPADVVALDLSGPSRECSREIDGLIGADFFEGKVVRIDYAKGVLSREEGLRSSSATPLRFANGVICAPVAVNGGGTRWTRLDTGCTDALDWCEGGCGCPKKPAGKSMALASAMGAPAPWRGVAEVSVGTEQLHHVPVTMRSREIFPGEAGLLGNGALSKYRAMTIDGIGKRLVLEREH